MVDVLLLLVGVYAGIGVLFAIGFVTWGVGRIDPAAAGSPVVFRLLILPGLAALWPVMAIRWAKAKGGLS